MSRNAVASGAAGGTRRRSQRNVKKESDDVVIKKENEVSTPKKATKRSAPASAASTGRGKRIKKEESPDVSTTPSTTRKGAKSEAIDELKTETPSPRKKTPKTSADKAAQLQARKLKAYTQFSQTSPFPDFAHPTRAECKLARRILASLHGDRARPKGETVAPSSRSGCGDSPSVLDALVRTILSQNTSDANSSRAKRSMDAAYGGSDAWEAIAAGGQARLQKTIESGGLSQSKSRVILDILRQAKERYGVYSLDHLFGASNEEAMTEMLGFQGVGPKTASCVLLFCLKRDSFAVDTHVHRITGLLGWRPKNCSREETHAHLEALIPDEDKYALHVLIISHGKKCDECKAGGKNLGKCELRKAFRGAKVKGEAGEEVKMEEVETIKKEEQEENAEVGQ